MEIELQFRMVHFAACDRYIGVAWKYDAGVLISTRDFASYAEARQSLSSTCEAIGKETGKPLRLRWFDGAYVVPKGSDQMVPA